MEMKTLRLVSYSLYYFIKEKLSESVSGNVCINTGDNINYYTEHSNILPWEQVNIYKNDILQSGNYTIYYRENEPAQIVFNQANNVNDVITSDYKYCYVYIYDHIPPLDDDGAEIKIPSVSIVHIDTVDIEGVEIGTNSYWDNKLYFIDLYAGTDIERDDISDYIREALLEGVPLINFNNGFPTKKDSTRNELYDKTTQTINYLEVVDIERTPIRELKKGKKTLYIMNFELEIQFAQYK